MAAELGLRRLLLAIVVVGAVGLILELLLLGHFEEWTQWLPLAVLGAVLATSLWLWRSAQRRAVLAFRGVMAAAAVTGAAGLVLHFAGNRAFELEMEPGLHGWLLVWHALRGATPALAPGALIQLGLLGLLVTWRHPALLDGRQERSET